MALTTSCKCSLCRHHFTESTHPLQRLACNRLSRTWVLIRGSVGSSKAIGTLTDNQRLLELLGEGSLGCSQRASQYQSCINF